MRANGRSLVSTWNALLLAAVCSASSCGGGDKPPAPVTSPVIAPPAQIARAIGDPDPNEAGCVLDATAKNRCVGYTPLDFGTADAGRVYRVVKTIERNGDWGGESEWTRRLDSDNSETAEYTVSAIRDSRSIAFKEFESVRGSLIMARIDVKVFGDAPDNVFGISSKDSAAYGTTYWVVVTGYSVGVPDAALKGTPIAAWTIFGYDGKAFKSFKSGRFIWCDAEHSEQMRKRGAWFTSCTGATAYGMIEARAKAVLGTTSLKSALVQYFGDKALNKVTAPELRAGLEAILNPAVQAASVKILVTDLELKALLQALEGGPDDPAWMTCGIGCCTTGPGS